MTMSYQEVVEIARAHETNNRILENNLDDLEKKLRRAEKKIKKYEQSIKTLVMSNAIQVSMLCQNSEYQDWDDVLEELIDGLD